MANSPAPKAPGKSSAAGGQQSTAQYFSQFNKGGPYFGPGGAPAPVFGGQGTPPPFSYGQPSGAPTTPTAPVDPAGESGGLETSALAATYEGDAGAGDGTGAAPAGGGATGGMTITDAFEAVGDTFVNPFTGQVESTQEAYAALLESDPEQMYADIMQQEMGKLAAAKTAAMQQQKAQFAAAGLGASGAMSADIAGTGASYAGQAATTALQIENQKNVELENWRKMKLDESVTLEELKQQQQKAFEMERLEASDFIGNYLTETMQDLYAQEDLAEMQTNPEMQSMIDEALGMMEKNNVGLEQAMPILRKIADWYIKNGIAFWTKHGKHGGIVYPSSKWGTGYSFASHQTVGSKGIPYYKKGDKWGKIPSPDDPSPYTDDLIWD